VNQDESKYSFSAGDKAAEAYHFEHLEHKEEFIELCEYVNDLTESIQTVQGAFRANKLHEVRNSPFNPLVVKFIYNKTKLLPVQSWKYKDKIINDIPGKDDIEGMVKFFADNFITEPSILISNFIVERMVEIRVSGKDIMSLLQVLVDTKENQNEKNDLYVVPLMAQIGEYMSSKNVVKEMKKLKEKYEAELKVLFTNQGNTAMKDWVLSLSGYTVCSTLWYILNPAGAIGFIISKVRKVSLLPRKKQLQRWKQTELVIFGIEDTTKLQHIFKQLAKEQIRNGKFRRRRMQLEKVIKHTYIFTHIFTMFLPDLVEFLEIIKNKRGIIGTHFSNELFVPVFETLLEHLEINDSNPHQILIHLFEEILGRTGYVNFYADLLTRVITLLLLTFSCIGKKWFSHQTSKHRFGINSGLCWNYQNFIEELSHYSPMLNPTTGQQKSFNKERTTGDQNIGYNPGGTERPKKNTKTLHINGVDNTTMKIGIFRKALNYAKSWFKSPFSHYYSNPGQIWTYCDPKLRQKVVDVGVMDKVKISLYRHPRATGLFYGIEEPTEDGKVTKRLHQIQDGEFDSVNLLEYPARVRQLIRKFGPRYT
jgi:hypothetical protein